MGKRKFKIDKFVQKYRSLILTVCAVIILSCFSLFISHAFYEVRDKETIIGGRVGKVADIEVRVLVQERDEDGKAIDSYEEYPYIPKAGYIYDSNKSYCVNNSEIVYDDANYQAKIVSKNTDLCYLYFSSIADLDLTLEVYQENTDEFGQGTGEYTKLETTSLPSVGYAFNSEKSNCRNNSEIKYNPLENMVVVEALGNDFCQAYMDVVDSDIKLNLKIQTKKGEDSYYEASEIPKNNYYVLNPKSSCDNQASVLLNKQKVIVNTKNKTTCDAYLDIDTGPILESVNVKIEPNNVTLDFKESKLGTIVQTWYYSTDGVNYVATKEKSVSFALDTSINHVIYVYGIDADNKTSALYEVTQEANYVYNGAFDYASTAQVVNITLPGYYLLEVWGAQGGSYSPSVAEGGKGGYATGTVYLEAGDTLYVHTGGQGSYNSNSNPTSLAGGGANGGGNAAYRGGGGGGATDIRLNSDELLARLIVAGGGGGASSYAEFKAAGGAAGGALAATGAYYNKDNDKYVGGGATSKMGGSAGIGSEATYNGESGTFGQGGNSAIKYADASYYSNGAGGGGWYGGGGAGNYNGASFDYAAGGGGGSGYVYMESTASLYPEGCLLNSKYYLYNASALGGTESFKNPSGAAEVGHTGNGYAKITYIGANLGE